MKRLIIILCVCLILPLISYAQDSTSTSKSASQSSSKLNPSDKKRIDFIDMNGNGIDDRKEAKLYKQRDSRRAVLKKDKKSADKFIDKDGDGINDRRVDGKGMGLGARKKNAQKGGRR
jgi:hypothetical protein